MTVCEKAQVCDKAAAAISVWTNFLARVMCLFLFEINEQGNELQ
jgi:hypothetical protein